MINSSTWYLYFYYC